MTEELLGASFRDPSGFVFRRGGTLYRQVNRSFTDQYDALLSSGLYDDLTEQGLLVRHQEVDPSLAATSEAYKVLRPDPLPFISHPYEWCFGQLRDAALATLEIQRRALARGMSLRDASAYNIQFHRGAPILIDTLSFERLPEGRPWVAYRQFCQHFLAPLALMARKDVRLGQLLRAHLDGVPLDLASRLLPRRTRYTLSLGLHVHAHARAQKRYVGREGAEQAQKRQMSVRSLQNVLQALERAVRAQRWEPEKSVWRDYYAESGSYTDEGLEHKRDLVGKFLAEIGPKTVWDLGANTGMFSRLAAERGAFALAFEFDHSCVEVAYRAARERGEGSVLPLLLDLTNPSPALGWASEERASFADRGPADLVLALALVHHLAIGNNVPLERVAAFFRRVARALVVEFVPKSDPKTELLLVSREDVFPDYTRQGFEAAFGRHFTIERVEELRGSERVLYLMR